MKVINLGTLSLEKCELSHYLSLIIIKVVVFWLSCNRKSIILRFLSFTDSNFKSAAPRKLRSQGLSLWNSPIPVEHRWAGLSCRWNPGGWGTCRLFLCSALTVVIWEGALVTLNGPFFRVPCGLRQEIQVCYGFFWAEGRFSSSERVSWEWAAGKWVAEVAKKSGSNLGWRSRAWEPGVEKPSLAV